MNLRQIQVDTVRPAVYIRYALEIHKTRLLLSFSPQSVIEEDQELGKRATSVSVNQVRDEWYLADICHADPGVSRGPTR